MKKKIISCLGATLLVSGCSGTGYDTLKTITTYDPTGASKVLLAPLMVDEEEKRRQLEQQIEDDKVKEKNEKLTLAFNATREQYLGKTLDEVVADKGVPFGTYKNSDGTLIVEWKEVWNAQYTWATGVCSDKFQFANNKMVKWISSSDCAYRGYRFNH